MKRRNFLAGLATSAAAALTWRPGAAARSGSGELGDQFITATSVEPDELVIATRDVGNELGGQGIMHDIDLLQRLDGDKIKWSLLPSMEGCPSIDAIPSIVSAILFNSFKPISW